LAIQNSLNTNKQCASLSLLSSLSWRRFQPARYRRQRKLAQPPKTPPPRFGRTTTGIPLDKSGSKL
jgi:hypothetical protein